MNHAHADEVALYGECITCARERASSPRRAPLMPPAPPPPPEPSAVQADLFGELDKARTGGQVGRDHPASSAQAGRSVRSGSQQAHLLAIVAAAPDGITCAAAAPLLSEAVGHEVSRNHTSTRMSELEERGLAARVFSHHDGDRLVYESRPTDQAGNVGAIWRATAYGREQLAALARAST